MFEFLESRSAAICSLINRRFFVSFLFSLFLEHFIKRMPFVKCFMFKKRIE